VLYSTQLVGEAAAFGVAHPVLGQAIVVVATPREGVPASREALLAECRQRLPAYMVPAEISLRPAPLPRNANGKIDRKLLAAEFVDLFQDEA
jgi:acyl-CoA synthetase (AMP-forming)/AMP-acid ligase II